MMAGTGPRPSVLGASPVLGASAVPAARVTVRYWAAARDAAGVREETIEADTLAVLFAAVAARHGGNLPALLRRCSYLVDEQPVGRRDPAGVILRDGTVVEALPPFAGG